MRANYKHIFQYHRSLFLGLLTMVLLSACEKDPPLPIEVECPPKTEEGLKYFFLGHPYVDRDELDPRIELMDRSRFDQWWLGGDMVSETTEKFSNLIYLEELFQISNPTTFWTLGNHDTRNGNQHWITDFTGRETYYTAPNNGMTMMILNMNLPWGDCASMNEQFDMIEAVCDTISESSHLVVLMHQVVWDSVDLSVDVFEFANTNYKHWQARCNPTGYFYNDIYPLLADVQDRGIQVVCVSGDGGQKDQKTGSIKSSDGIWFLLSGINNYNERDPDKRALLPPDQVLIFEHWPENRELTWTFENLDSLSQVSHCE